MAGRVEKDNAQGLELRAIIEVAPLDYLLARAKQLDQERAERKVRSVLHGVPIVVK